MRNAFRFGTFFAILVLLFSCKEEKHGIVYVIPEKPLLDTTYTTAPVPAAQDHEVLLFDVTGVRCVNCPDAARIARKIADTLNPGRVVVVALYPESPTPLWWPWPGYDTMSSSYAESMVQSLGGVAALPTGCVDQVQVSGKRFLDRNTWLSQVNSRLSFANPMNINLTTSWDNSKNRGRLEAKITYTANQTSKNLIFIAITESKVIGKQSNLTGEILDYAHNHALRKLYTATTGDTLRADLKPGRVFEKHYYINPRYNWNPKNLDAVVWVVDASSKEVLQVAHAKMQP
jgi:hypothetical protein